MPSTTSNPSAKKTVLKAAYAFILAYTLFSSAVVFFLASTGDTTRLGDPYYENLIMAPQRAFIPWLLTLVSVGLLFVLRIALWIFRRKLL